MQDKVKEEKEKVTLYLPSDLHRQLKIRAAIDREPMSDIAEKAIAFYLSHSDVVETAGIGRTHQVFNCPECSQSVVFRNGDLLAIGKSPTVGKPSVAAIGEVRGQDGELVPC